MLILEINNSYTKILNMTTPDYLRIREAVSYKLDAKAMYFSNHYGPRVKYLLDKKGMFPTGILSRVEGFFKESGTKYAKVDQRKLPTPIHKAFSGFKCEHVIRVAQVQATNKAKQAHRGIISMPTGTGKSLVIALIISELKVRTLVVVPSLEIKNQLKSTLMELFGSLENIDVENIDSVNLKTAKTYDCLIVDECHHSAAKTYQKLNKTVWNSIYYRFFLTATPYRNQEEEQILFESICGQVIYNISYKDAITKNYIVPVEAYYIEIPKTQNDCYTWAETYSKLVVNNETRNILISKILSKLHDQDLKTLCLVKEINHGEKLKDLTNGYFINGQDETTRRLLEYFNTGSIRTLIGTTGILGEGIDTKPAEYIVIAGLGKAKSAFLQQIGRGVRIYPGKQSCKVILIKDRSHKFLLRHYNAQVKILKEELGIVPIKLEID